MMRTFFTILLLITGVAVFSQTLSVYKSEISVDETTKILVDVIKESNLIFFETVAHDKKIGRASCRERV